MFLPTTIVHASHTGRIVLTETPLSAALRATRGAFVQDNLAIRAADKSLGNPDFVCFSGGWEDGSLQPRGLPSSPPSSPGCWQKMSWRGFPQHRVIVTCSALPYAQGCCSLPCSKYFSFSQGWSKVPSKTHLRAYMSHQPEQSLSTFPKYHLVALQTWTVASGPDFSFPAQAWESMGGTGWCHHGTGRSWSWKISGSSVEDIIHHLDLQHRNQSVLLFWALLPCHVFCTAWQRW